MKIRNILLALGGSFAMLVACGNDEVTPVTPEDPTEDPKDVSILVTTTNLSWDLTWTGANFSKKDNMSPTTVTIDPTVRYQEIDGFGAAITGATCYNLSLMTAEDRAKFLQTTFSDENGFGFNYIRISIGCSDFSLSEYTCCDTPGIENFALQSEEKKYIIPVLKDILAINPKIKIMGSPWTCPRWMKVNNLSDLKPYESWTGGQLNPAFYQDYGTYFVKWLQAFANEGIDIYSITVQNEPLNRGNSASLFMGWEEQRDFVKSALGPQMKAAGLKTKIYSFDHNYNYDNLADQKFYPGKIFQDSDAGDYFAGSAYHNYGGSRDELNVVHNNYPEKELVFTETSIGEWNDGRNLKARLLEDMREVTLGTVNNWCRGAIAWNLMLDNDRAPNRDGGCKTCYGAVDIDNSNYKTIIRNSHYYIMAHMSAVVKTGAVRIGSSGYKANKVMYSAFENTDGTYAFVLLNDTDEAKKITVSDGTHHFAYEVPAKAVVSYRWKK